VSIGLHGDLWSINLVATKTQGTRALDGIGEYDRGDIKLALLLAHLAMLVASSGPMPCRQSFPQHEE
jgi:fructosamine-3-kinase